jgi:hypothetical protein
MTNEESEIKQWLEQAAPCATVQVGTERIVVDQDTGKLTTEPVKHWSDCSVHSEPAYPAGECDCHLSPVAKVISDFDGGQKRIVFLNEQRMTDTSVGTELGIYRQWQNLTIDEINEVLGSDIHDEPSGTLDFVRAIEAKLKEKNT